MPRGDLRIWAARLYPSRRCQRQQCRSPCPACLARDTVVTRKSWQLNSTALPQLDFSASAAFNYRRISNVASTGWKPRSSGCLACESELASAILSRGPPTVHLLSPVAQHLVRSAYGERLGMGLVLGSARGTQRQMKLSSIEHGRLVAYGPVSIHVAG